RQVTALSTFRLEKERGGSFDEALQRAEQAIIDTHFIYTCVDTETECLTEEGWKQYDQIQVGETVYGVDADGQLIEDSVQAVNVHAGQHQILSFRNENGFEMAVTGNHRCVIQNYNSRDKKWQKPLLREASNLRNNNYIVRVPLSSAIKREKVYSNDFVELMAWVLAEGSYHRMRNCLQKREVRIVQSPTHNPEYVREIDALLCRLGGHFKRYDYPKQCTMWRLRKPLSGQVLDAAPDKLITQKFVKDLTVEQMELFLYVFSKADGHHREGWYEGTRSGWTIAQKSDQNVGFLQMMATMTGQNSVLYKRNNGQWNDLYLAVHVKRTTMLRMKRTEKVVDTVWCPTTTSGTWIARRGGRVFVTGNSHNRPRYMSGNVLRVLTQFKQYSQNIAYTYGRAAAIWLDKHNATAEERTVAKRQLISMLALQFGAAGALGMPFFGAGVDVLMAVVNAFGDDDDKRDWEVALRKWLDGSATSLAEAFIDDKDKAREIGKELAEVVSHGASRLTPWDMAGRLGQGDLFFREPQREREGRQAVMDWMMALGGPVPSYGVNFLLGMGDVAKGVTDLNAGFFLRGVEELTPAVLRNGVKSLRYVLEDVRTRDQYKQLELDKRETLGQAFGFTPSRVAEMYESTTAVKNKEHRILNQRKALLERFSRAIGDQDDDAKERTIDAIRSFNEREPMFAITSNTLNRSLKTRAQREAGMERGIYLPPRRRALLEEGDFADF
ncbi:MAG: PLxRFG domain-containing protein, partial [Cetobacterium sp.]